MFCKCIEKEILTTEIINMSSAIPFSMHIQNEKQWRYHKKGLGTADRFDFDRFLIVG